MIANRKQPRHLLPRLQDQRLGVHLCPGRGYDGPHEGRTPNRRRELEDVTGRVAARVHIFWRQLDVPDRVLTKAARLEEDRVWWLAIVNNG